MAQEIWAFIMDVVVVNSTSMLSWDKINYTPVYKSCRVDLGVAKLAPEWTWQKKEISVTYKIGSETYVSPFHLLNFGGLNRPPEPPPIFVEIKGTSFHCKNARWKIEVKKWNTDISECISGCLKFIGFWGPLFKEWSFNFRNFSPCHISILCMEK